MNDSFSDIEEDEPFMGEQTPPPMPEV